MFSFKFVTLLEHLAIFNLVLLTGSIYAIDNASVLFLFSFFILAVLLMTRRYLYRGNLNELLYFLFFSISVLFLNFIFSPSNTINEYVTLFLRIVLGSMSLMVLGKHMGNHIIDLFYKVLFFVCMLSVLGWICSFIYPGQLLTLPSGFSAYSIGYIHFYASLDSVFGVNVYRNQGFFWEPGVLSFFMNLLLLLALSKKKCVKDALFISFVIMSTMSTTGLFTCLIQWGVFILKGTFVSRRVKLLIMSALVAPLAFLVYASLFEKINNEKIDSSYGLRALDLYTSSKVILNHPFWGVGFNKETQLSSISSCLPVEFQEIESVEGRGSSNGLSNYFMFLGIPVSLLILYLLYKQMILLHNRFIVFCVLIIGLSSEPLGYSPLFAFFIFSGFDTAKLKFIYRKYIC